MEFISRVYGSFLSLFLRNYREEYVEELQVVFELSLKEADTENRFEVVSLILRELDSLPMAAILEHLRNRQR